MKKAKEVFDYKTFENKQGGQNKLDLKIVDILLSIREIEEIYWFYQDFLNNTSIDNPRELAKKNMIINNLMDNVIKRYTVQFKSFIELLYKILYDVKNGKNVLKEKYRYVKYFINNANFMSLYIDDSIQKYNEYVKELFDMQKHKYGDKTFKLYRLYIQPIISYGFDFIKMEFEKIITLFREVDGYEELVTFVFETKLSIKDLLDIMIIE